MLAITCSSFLLAPQFLTWSWRKGNPPIVQKVIENTYKTLGFVACSYGESFAACSCKIRCSQSLHAKALVRRLDIEKECSTSCWTALLHNNAKHGRPLRSLRLQRWMLYTLPAIKCRATVCHVQLECSRFLARAFLLKLSRSRLLARASCLRLLLLPRAYLLEFLLACLRVSDMFLAEGQSANCSEGNRKHI